ncbi:hypothetical protein QQ045_020373 [Rhodiola kirilowii]
MQRSRILWMNHGDKNTQKFHASASQRRKKNWIEKLQNSRGVLQVEQPKIMDVVTSYFGSIFQSSFNGDYADLEEQLGSVSPVISEEMNFGLLKDLTGKK